MKLSALSVFSLYAPPRRNMLTWVCLVLFAIVPSSLSCRCNQETSRSGGQCKTEYKGRRWCYVDPGQGCQDERKGTSSNRLWSYQACENSSDDNGNIGSGQICVQVLCCGSDGVTYPTPCSVPRGVTCVDFNECPGKRKRTPGDVINFPGDSTGSELGCPANGWYPDTKIFCINEDGSSNCQQRSDCPDHNDTCDSSLRVCTKTEQKCEKVAEQQCFDKEDGSSSCQTVFKEECVFDGQQVKSISGTTGQAYRGSQSIGSISSRCPRKTPCPYRAGCGRLVGLGPGGRLPACPRRRWTGK